MRVQMVVVLVMEGQRRVQLVAQGEPPLELSVAQGGRGEWAEFWAAHARKHAKRRLRTVTKNVRHFRVDSECGCDYDCDSDWKRGSVDDLYLEIESVRGFVFVDDHDWD